MKVIEGWTLLRHERDYKSWHKKEAAFFGCEPKTFPCFVQAAIDSSDDPYYKYLYPALVKDMTAAFKSTEALEQMVAAQDGSTK